MHDFGSVVEAPLSNSTNKPVPDASFCTVIGEWSGGVVREDVSFGGDYADVWDWVSFDGFSTHARDGTAQGAGEKKISAKIFRNW
jgi:hypothetical protein